MINIKSAFTMVLCSRLSGRNTDYRNAPNYVRIRDAEFTQHRAHKIIVAYIPGLIYPA